MKRTYTVLVKYNKTHMTQELMRDGRWIKTVHEIQKSKIVETENLLSLNEISDRIVNVKILSLIKEYEFNK